MNNVINTSPAQLPIYQDRPANRAVAPVASGDGEFPDARKNSPSTYVYRGELLETFADNRRYNPRFNQQIDPQHRNAIDTYQRVASIPTRIGQILDGYI